MTLEETEGGQLALQVSTNPRVANPSIAVTDSPGLLPSFQFFYDNLPNFSRFLGRLSLP